MERTKGEKENNQNCNMIKYNLYSLNDESTKILYQQRLSQTLGENRPESAGTFYEHIYMINSAASEALGEQEKSRKGRRKYMLSEELEDEVRRKKISYLTA